MELGGSVWMLDRDQDGPWKMVEKKASKKASTTSGMERPLLTASRESENIIRRTTTHDDKYEVITVTADSGAADHVAPKNVATHIRTQETSASRQGMKYVAANGHRIANEGQKAVRGLTSEGIPLNMVWQVAEVKRPLASIGRICDAGNTAIFTQHGGHIVPEQALSKTLEVLEKRGESLRLEREGGVYNFKMWIPRPPTSIKNSNRFTPLQEMTEEDMDFRWPGADAL